MSRVEELDLIKALRGGLAAIQNILDHAEGLRDAQECDQVDRLAAFEIIEGLSANLVEPGHVLGAEASDSARKAQQPAKFNGELRRGGKSGNQMIQGDSSINTEDA